MKFAHLADCHIGGWKEPELQELNLQTFETALDMCMAEHVNFIIIAGDFFDTSLPSIDVLKRAVRKVKELSDAGIQLYLVPGSHDFSVSGKSMLEVLESAGLCVNLSKLLEDDSGKIKLNLLKQNGVAITGLLGRRNNLEIELLRNLDKKHIEKQISRESGLKIFVAHTAVSELLPENLKEEYLETISLEELPKGFDYYAIGHIHNPKQVKFGSGIAAYPGALFPNNFAELEELGKGNFLIVSSEDGKVETEKKEIKLKEILPLHVDVDGLSSGGAEKKLHEEIERAELKDKVLLLRVEGTLSEGRIAEIGLHEIVQLAKQKGCYAALRNTHKLSTQEFKPEEISQAKTADEIEEELLAAYLSGLSEGESKNKAGLLKKLFEILHREKHESETTSNFEESLLKELFEELDLENDTKES